ncbi:MAG: response regulator receiver modulated PilZ sensor protein [Myxococcales bacterium]|nr:response regulator receiver modulated PilZ sensor protein [Myxococcales bacterium]
MAADRRQPRLPISLEVQYRTAGAFLVSYSVNLSKGGLFLETTTPLDPGEHVSLSFEVPGVGPLAVQGVVAWVRKDSKDGLPDGMGIQFDTLDSRYGETIDLLVRDFVGLTVLVIAASPDRLALIGRYVRSIIACEIVEATNASVAEVALDQGPDLVVVDLDLNPEMGLRAIRAAKVKAEALAHATPVILLAGDARVRQAGKTSGADEALATPPSYHELQAAVIRTLSRPAAVR